MQGSTVAKRVWLLFFLAIIACYFYGLGRPALVGPDEPRYAQVAREMFLRADPVTPTLGGHTWFEKPSLLYWMMMAAYKAFGQTEFAARFGPACAGLLTVLLVFWLGRRVERAVLEERAKPKGLGAWSSLALATSAGLMVFSRGASFDIIVTMTVTLALSCFYVSELERDAGRRRWLLAGFYAGVGLSLLAKGLVGIVIPFGVVGAYFLMRRRWPERRVWVSLLWGAPLALGLAATWYWPVTARHGWTFIDDFFIQHHFARYVSNKYLHPQPFWFYLPITLALIFPWSAVLVASLAGARRWRWRSQQHDALSSFQVFAFAWVVVPVLFFSLSGSKLPGYVLPAVPGALLLVGEYLVRFLKGETGRAAMRVTGGLLICLALGGAVYAVRVQRVSTVCLMVMAVPLAAAGIFLLFWTHERRLSVVILIAAMLTSSVFGVGCVADLLSERESVRSLMRRAEARGYATARVYGLHTIEHTAEFYAAGRVAREPNGKAVRFEGPQQVEAVLKDSQTPVLVFVPVEHAAQLTGYAPLAAEALGDNGSVALFAVRGREK